MDIPSTDEIKERLKDYPSLTMPEIEVHAAVVHDILRLKKKHNAVILGHNYMEPLVFECSSEEEKGDSYALSAYAAKSDADYIIFNGVRFMAETAKILNPDKKVLIADRSAGCSLADNFKAEHVKELKKQHPGVPVMIYINSYAESKAECDVVCTSANAVKIAKAMPGDEIIFVPDILFAQNLAEDLKGIKTVHYPNKQGNVCEVHEKFSISDINAVRKSFDIPKGHPKRRIYAHWECNPEVLREADFYGSTSQIRNDIASHDLERVFIASECELTANLSAEFPKIQFYTACSVRCSHMAKITLDKLHMMLLAIDKGESLEEFEVSLSEDVIEKSKAPIEKMLDLA